MKKVGFLAAALLLSASGLSDVPGLNRAKLIAHGWDTLVSTPRELLANAEAWDASGFDGATVGLAGRHPDGTPYNFRDIASEKPWTDELVAGHKEAVREFARHRGLRESLPMVWLSPKKRIGWADDRRWRIFAGNMATVARFARQTGLKGILLDNEDYPGSKQWFYDPSADGDDYESVRRQSRRRGAELGEAVFREFPDIRLLAFWFNSLFDGYVMSSDPVAAARDRRDLWPAFIDGILDVMPPQARLIDGDENAYHSDAAKCDFYVNAWNHRQGTLALVSPENRAKYLSQMSSSFGIYLDMYVSDDKGGIWYFGPGEDGTRLSRLSANLWQAARVAPEYVWVYGEKQTFVPWRTDIPEASAGKDPRFAAKLRAGTATWETALPGLTQALFTLTDPQAVADRALAATTTNLIGKITTWQHRFSKGTLEVTNGEASADRRVLRAKGVSNGCFVIQVDAVPGEIYAISGAVRGKGELSVTWRMKPDGALTVATPAASVAFGGPDADGWRRGRSAFLVPPGTKTIEIHPGFSRQQPDEQVEFTGLRLVKVR